MNDCDRFIEYISRITPPDELSENIYKGKGLSEIRRNNLKTYLNDMLRHRPDTILIGEAPGYHGCGKTGIAFTDEHSINSLEFFKDGYAAEGNEREMSAGTVWSVLTDYPHIPFMWNIYPFQPQNNRTPNRKETELGKEILAELFKLFDFKHVYCIGKTSFNNLTKSYPDARYIRHPAHGGITLCKSQLTELLK